MQNLTTIVKSRAQTIWYFGEIWGSHGDEYKNGYLLGYSIVWSGSNWPMFQRSLLPPSCGSERKLWGVSGVAPYNKLVGSRRNLSKNSRWIHSRSIMLSERKNFKMLSLNSTGGIEKTYEKWNSGANTAVQNVIWSANTCFAVPLHRPSRNEPSQNQYCGAQAPD
jgi:hypothetical protein